MALLGSASSVTPILNWENNFSTALLQLIFSQKPCSIRRSNLSLYRHFYITRDFDKVWSIFDSAQTREFRKVVQSIISELESQGALPRSNSRFSSLATCCGPRLE